MLDHFAAPWVARDRYELRADARRFETWENNYAARLGLGLAIDYAMEIGLDVIEARCRLLAGTMRAALSRIPGIALHDLGPDPSAIVSFTVDGREASDVVRGASQAGISIGISDPSSTRLDAEARALPPLVRASPHYYNSAAEIERLVRYLG